MNTTLDDNWKKDAQKGLERWMETQLIPETESASEQKQKGGLSRQSSYRGTGSGVGGQLKAASLCVLLAQCFASHAGAQHSPTSHWGYTHPQLSDVGRERKEGWEKGCQEDYKTLQHEEAWETYKILLLCTASTQPFDMLNDVAHGSKYKFAEKSTSHWCIAVQL